MYVHKQIYNYFNYYQIIMYINLNDHTFCMYTNNQYYNIFVSINLFLLLKLKINLQMC